MMKWYAMLIEAISPTERSPSSGRASNRCVGSSSTMTYRPSLAGCPDGPSLVSLNVSTSRGAVAILRAVNCVSTSHSFRHLPGSDRRLMTTPRDVSRSSASHRPCAARGFSIFDCSLYRLRSALPLCSSLISPFHVVPSKDSSPFTFSSLARSRCSRRSRSSSRTSLWACDGPASTAAFRALFLAESEIAGSFTFSSERTMASTPACAAHCRSVRPWSSSSARRRASRSTRCSMIGHRQRASSRTVALSSSRARSNVQSPSSKSARKNKLPRRELSAPFRRPSSARTAPRRQPAHLSSANTACATPSGVLISLLSSSHPKAGSSSRLSALAPSGYSAKEPERLRCLEN
mmetsp:Transcript_44702/g.118074  ORF Transcript_44702/g.118074 Transcript_44702/m.118074 type:complete len:348 (+) Transcript_44702:369-1412(+)